MIEENSNNKVLIVDDNLMNLKVEKTLLEKVGILSDTCTSGKECLEIIKTGKKYDVILMDDMMPEMTGTETMQTLKNNMNYDKPIIVITANAKITDKDNYLRAGFDDYIAKPAGQEILKTILQKYIH